MDPEQHAVINYLRQVETNVQFAQVWLWLLTQCETRLNRTLVILLANNLANFIKSN